MEAHLNTAAKGKNNPAIAMAAAFASRHDLFSLAASCPPLRWAAQNSTMGHQLSFAALQRPAAVDNPNAQLGISAWTTTFREGQYSIGARYYQSELGRFLSPDWTDYPEPVPNGDLADPQSLNLYAYAENNPTGAIDPDGHDCITTSNASPSGVTVTIASGQCTGSSGTYVAGTVNASSLSYNGATGDIGYGYTPYAGGSGTGVLNIAPPVSNSNIPAFLSAFDATRPGSFIGAFAGASVAAGTAAAAISGAAAAEAGAEAAESAGEAAFSQGQLAQAQRILETSGRDALERGLRTLEKRLAAHLEDLEQYRAAGGYTSKTLSEIRNFRQLIAAYKSALGM